MKLLQTVRKKILPVFVPEEFIHQVKYVNKVHLAKCVGGGETCSLTHIMKT